MNNIEMLKKINKSKSDIVELNEQLDSNNNKLNKNLNDIKGITVRNYVKGKFYTREYREEFLNIANELNINSVSLVFNTYQRYTNSSDIEYADEQSRWWTTYQEIYDYCKYLKENNFHIMLKPHVEPVNDHTGTIPSGTYVPRDLIEPSDVNLWFSNYKKWLEPYINMANELNIEVFCIGCEYKGLTTLENENLWIDLIESIRSKYNGMLTYASYYTANLYEEANWLTFWDKLDFIGLDFYINFNENLTNYETALIKDKSDTNTIINVDGLVDKFKKKILFTEFAPLMNVENRSKWWEATFKAFINKEYFKGGYLWAYEPCHNNLISPFDETSKDVIKKYYKSDFSKQQKNSRIHIIPKTNTTKWYKIFEVENKATWFKNIVNCKVQNLQSNGDNIGNFTFYIASNNSTFDYVQIKNNSRNNLNASNFGYEIKDNTLSIYLKINQYNYYSYAINSVGFVNVTNYNHKMINNLYKDDVTNKFTDFKSPMYIEDFTTSDGTIKLNDGSFIQIIEKTVSLNNGVYKGEVEIPKSIGWRRAMIPNVKSVSGDEVYNVNFNLYDTGKTNTVGVGLKHLTINGQHAVTIQITVIGK